MVSDDAQHTCMVAQALIESGSDPEAFARSLARRFRRWLLLLPAGVGLATLRAILKLWMGFAPDRSGVWSAGNGPAMRSAILGAAVEDMASLRRLVRASTRLTHTDPKAEQGALAIALAARMARDGSGVEGGEYMGLCASAFGDFEENGFLQILDRAAHSARKGESARQFADSLGLVRGVPGYVFHSVPVAIHIWLGRQGRFREAIQEAVQCGGDTDTLAAMVGGMLGAGGGKAAIPQDWLDGLFEWPATVEWMEELGRRLARRASGDFASKSPQLPFWAESLRGALFLIIVLAHGFRRLLPPY